MVKRIIMITVALMSVSSIAIAGEALVVTWQKSNGKWKSCGPVQRLSLSENSERVAIDRVTGNRDEANLRYVGKQGKYHVYSTGRQLQHSDFNATRCMSF